MHAGRILREQRFKACLDLVHHSSGREIRVDQIAEIQHARVAPIAAVASLELFRAATDALSENGFRDIQILHIVNFIPALAFQAFCPEGGVVEHGNHTQDLLVVLVFSQCLDVGIQEGNVLLL